MRRDQVWCDQPNCGREIQLKNWPKGAMDHNEADKSWEVWTPSGEEESTDRVYCSLECLVSDMSELLHIRQKTAAELSNEN